MQIDPFLGFTLAILLLFIGKGVVGRIELLRRYSIPEAMIGGVFCAVLVCVLYYTLGVEVTFDLGARDLLLLYFFAAIGLNTSLRTLAQGGRPLLILAVLAVVFMVLQNLVGMGLAGAYGMDPRAGLMVGSVSLTGGVGTTLAWTPHFVETLGIEGAAELGLSANMIGLMAACLIGGPIAGVLMRVYQITPSGDMALEIGTLHSNELHSRLDYHGVLLALLWLNLTLMLGQGISTLVAMTPLKLPAFVGCLLAGIILRAMADMVVPNERGRLWNLPSMRPGLALISDICLGLFLTMALMGLKFWELQPVLGFITVAMLLQITLVVVFVFFVVFPAMGRNYESAVICSGFGGVALGSTATAIASMTAVTREFGAARQAFIVVPLVCGFLIDLANAVVIGLMAG
ncbi:MULTISPECIES: sodium/glutamate symporter [Pseudomonas]|uniref:Sodium/glutamate symporter n=1 Tax=Pseudomonas helleri TaxID=1608996 RepID=A0A6L5HVH1_9PSED|nr:MULTISPECIES: sodium/glutamate symporter [Pseudomonas]MQT47880.1 sodium/glutamate symporter [Pseudomonas helleri]MQT59183.1 sodium/glutamate symporter [Pseudomonas sp. FSL R10-0399]MQT88751.1 sodium/glutamate symporter [Pseudomonas helleri]MQU06435.1 sodium/glutamate symporter [Pseudomonas helleri]